MPASAPASSAASVQLAIASETAVRPDTPTVLGNIARQATSAVGASTEPSGRLIGLRPWTNRRRGSTSAANASRNVPAQKPLTARRGSGPSTAASSRKRRPSAIRIAPTVSSAVVSRATTRAGEPDDPGARAGSPPPSLASLLAPVAATAAAASAAVAVAAARPLLARLAGRSVLRPLDELLGRHNLAVLVLGDELEADPAAGLVDLLHEHVEHVAAADYVLDVADPAGADVRDVEEAVGALLQLDERAEVGRLHDLPGVLVADLGLLRERLDRGARGVGLRGRRRVDQDRPVLLDVDLDVVVALERADRLAALADDHPDELGIDLDRRDPRRRLGQLRPRLGDHLEHLVEDRRPRPLRLVERVPHDLLRHARDLDVHLQRGDPVARAGDLEVHVTEVILGSLDIGEDDVVVALLDEAHRDPADRRLDRHAGVHQR